MNDIARQNFIEVHSRFQGMVTQMCLGFVKGDRELANDLTQDVFVNVWKAIAGYRGDATIKTWIYRITVNTCLQHLRKEKNKSTIDIGNDNIAIVDELSKDYGDLYKAIGQLNEVDRLIIMMVLDELEYEEIANVIGINEATLRVKIHRIKQRLKKILEYAS